MPRKPNQSLVDVAIRANILRVVRRLRTSEPALFEPLNSGGLKIVGAEYSLDEGRVEFIED